MASQKLGRTIEELEHAFSDWDALGLSAAPSAKRAPAGESGKKATKTAPKASMTAAEQAQFDQQKELRKKTKKLLGQLRKQLNAL